MKINRLNLSLMMMVLSSCVAYTKFPEIPPPQAVITPPKLCPSVVCKNIPIPPQVPKTVHLIIEGGNITADAGGEKLLDNYLEFRKLVRDTWYAPSH